jgi:hypothetical protein
MLLCSPSCLINRYAPRDAGAEASATKKPDPARRDGTLAVRSWTVHDGSTVEAARTAGTRSALAPQESLICLQPPPFHTIAAEIAECKTGDFWERFCRLDQIVPEKALIIGDFGLGSDAAIILDFARDGLNPPVLWLRWGPERRNEWVQGARDFDEFAELLGLTEGVA